MRKVTEVEYQTSKAFIASALPSYAGTDWNAHATNVELYELEHCMPAKFSAYAVVDNTRSHITTWTGEVIARVTREGKWHRNNFGGKWRQLTIRADWNQTYTGREYDSRQLVNFRRIA
jgi:hypothetical protein